MFYIPTKVRLHMYNVLLHISNRAAICHYASALVIVSLGAIRHNKDLTAALGAPFNQEDIKNMFNKDMHIQKKRS